MLHTPWLLINLIYPLVHTHSIPEWRPLFATDDAFINVPGVVRGPPVTEAEMEAALLNNNLVEPPSEISPISTQTQYFQGDIILQSEDEFLDLLNNDTDVLSEAISDPEKLWPGAVIPYKISNQFSQKERSVIARAFAEYKQFTCIRFINQATETDYVYIIKGNGCYSSVGRNGGKQLVSLANGCLKHYGTVLHELMHAAGFYHEQSRYDRDDNVIIHWDNIQKNHKHNFDKHGRSVTKDLGLPYDFKSVMHYTWNEFGIDKELPTISPKEKGQTILGQRKGFSEVNVIALNFLYNCCADNDDQCSYWAMKGECTRIPTFMLEYCKQSCNRCDVPAENVPAETKCPAGWSLVGNQCYQAHLFTEGLSFVKAQEHCLSEGASLAQPRNLEATKNFLQATIVALKDDGKAKCPDGWSMVGDQCYQAYYHFSERLSFDDAYKHCLSQNASLAQPCDPHATKDFLRRIRQAMPITERGLGEYWLGGRHKGGPMQWLIGGGVIPNDQFVNGSPRKVPYNCLQMRPLLSNKYAPFATDNCNWLAGYLCEIGLSLVDGQHKGGATQWLIAGIGKDSYNCLELQPLIGDKNPPLTSDNCIKPVGYICEKSNIWSNNGSTKSNGCKQG